MKTLLKLSVIVLLLMLPLVVTQTPDSVQSADENTCPEIVAQAWQTLDEACANGVRNSACYGHILLDASPQPFVTNFQFDTVGDLANLADIQSLRLSSMDLNDGSWGVALVTLQANIPASMPDENVALLMFGDVQIDNAAPQLPQVDVYANAGGYNANVRVSPNADATALGVIPRGGSVVATGRLADNSWVRVQLPDADQAGWVSGDIIRTAPEDDLNSLDIVQPNQPFYGPMQAFYLTAAVDDAACPEAPNSGILVQTPEGVAEVTLLINEVDISIGSTVFFQSYPGEVLKVSVIEGKAEATYGGVTNYAITGTQLFIPLGDDGAPAGPPSVMQPFDPGNLGGLPLDRLPQQVEVGEPLSQAEINAELGIGDDDTGEDEGESGGEGDGDGGGEGEGDGGETPTEEPPPTPEGPVLVTICHNGNTTQVPENAVNGHLGHGDTLGACP